MIPSTFQGRDNTRAACLGCPPVPRSEDCRVGKRGTRGQESLASGSFYSAPQHMPRHPLQDGLFYVLADYRTAKAIGLTYSTKRHRREALGIIAKIKAGAQ